MIYNHAKAEAKFRKEWEKKVRFYKKICASNGGRNDNTAAISAAVYIDWRRRNNVEIKSDKKMRKYSQWQPSTEPVLAFRTQGLAA